MSTAVNRGAALAAKLREERISFVDEDGLSHCSIRFSDYSEALEGELLQLALQGPVVVWYDDEPDDAQLRPDLVYLSAGVWCGTARSVESTMKWLYLGGWFLSDAPSQMVMDYVKASPSITEERAYARALLQAGATFFVASFFDDCEWKMWLRR